MATIVRKEFEGGVKFEFDGATVPGVADALERLLISEGYRLEFGDKMKGAYGIGNEIMRLFFGAFVKRFRFNFEIKDEAGIPILEFKKDSLSKFSGGVIGYKKLESEFNKLVEKINLLQFE